MSAASDLAFAVECALNNAIELAHTIERNPYGLTELVPVTVVMRCLDLCAVPGPVYKACSDLLAQLDLPITSKASTVLELARDALVCRVLESTL